MSGRSGGLGRIELQGLELAPAQVFGGLRLVPVLRRRAPRDLWLAFHHRDDEPLLAPEAARAAYLPHAMIVARGERGEPKASFGARLGAARGREALDAGGVSLFHRLGRRWRDQTRRRLLPLHLSVEGSLARHFGGPEIAWSEYSRQALRGGVSPATPRARALRGVDDALRVFELHDDQVGLLLFVADSLAMAFVVPSPDDYRQLHRTLLVDVQGEKLAHYGELYPEELPLALTIEGDRVSSLEALRAELERVRREWAAFHQELAGGLLGRTVVGETLTRLGTFRLIRFLTPLDPRQDNHLGEAILRDDGTLEYLRSDRLSAAQCRRALLLQRLSAHAWHLEATASAHSLTRSELLRRLENAGLGYLLREDLLNAARLRL